MIIIETPAPPTLERLVLVPADAVSRTASEPALNVHTSAGRDATPADLARGGYERLGPEVLRVSAAEWRELKLRAEGREAHGEPGTLAHLRADLRDAVRRAEHAEQLTSELQATIARAFSYIEHTPGVQYLDAEVKKLGERAEKAEGLLIQRETELRLAREDGDERARDLRQAYERAVAAAEKAERERDEALGRAQSETEWRVRAVSERQDAEAERDTLRAEVAEASKALLEAGCGSALPLAGRVALLVGACARLRAGMREAKELARVLEVERDEAKAGHNAVQPRVYALEAELADAKAECAGAMLSAHAQYAETVRERDTARAELARLTAPASEGVSLSRQIAKLRDAQPAKDRATDDELVAIAETAYEAAGRGRGGCVEAAALAVAAHVRQERCLVAQAVAANVDIRVCEDDGGGFMVGVHESGCDEELERAVLSSDVPATLARLLGEVSRG